MQNKNYFVILIFVFIFLMGFFLVSYASKNLAIEGFKNIKYVQIAGQNVKVDLALTSAEHSRGLSGRSILNKDEGMLFVFVKSGRYYFWMKEMNFPIDIVWFTKDMKIIYIKKNANPLLYPETYGPSVNSKYVLEVPAGFADKNNLKVGDNVLFTY